MFFTKRKITKFIQKRYVHNNNNSQPNQITPYNSQPNQNNQITPSNSQPQQSKITKYIASKNKFSSSNNDDFYSRILKFKQLEAEKLEAEKLKEKNSPSNMPYENNQLLIKNFGLKYEERQEKLIQQNKIKNELIFEHKVNPNTIIRKILALPNHKFFQLKTCDLILGAFMTYHRPPDAFSHNGWTMNIDYEMDFSKIYTKELHNKESLNLLYKQPLNAVYKNMLNTNENHPLGLIMNVKNLNGNILSLNDVWNFSHMTHGNNFSSVQEHKEPLRLLNREDFLVFHGLPRYIEPYQFENYLYNLEIFSPFLQTYILNNFIAFIETSMILRLDYNIEQLTMLKTQCKNIVYNQIKKANTNIVTQKSPDPNAYNQFIKQTQNSTATLSNNSNNIAENQTENISYNQIKSADKNIEIETKNSTPNSTNNIAEDQTENVSYNQIKHADKNIVTEMKSSTAILANNSNNINKNDEETHI